MLSKNNWNNELKFKRLSFSLKRQLVARLGKQGRAPGSLWTSIWTARRPERSTRKLLVLLLCFKNLLYGQFPQVYNLVLFEWRHLTPYTPCEHLCRAHAAHTCAAQTARLRSLTREIRAEPSPWNSCSRCNHLAETRAVRWALWNIGVSQKNGINFQSSWNGVKEIFPDIYFTLFISSLWFL